MTTLNQAVHMQTPPSKQPHGTPNFCLVLLYSYPDTVHSLKLHRTLKSTTCTYGGLDQTEPRTASQPCCSGLQVQGTANSPLSAVSILYGTFKKFATKIKGIFVKNALHSVKILLIYKYISKYKDEDGNASFKKSLTESRVGESR